MLFPGSQWPWYAVEVRTSTERTATTHLEKAGYECFLPLIKWTHRLPDRTNHVELPMFSGYIFCRMNPHNALPVMQTPGVMCVIGSGKSFIPVEEREVGAIQKVVKSGLATMPWPYLPIGFVARIQEGPLSGLTGIVIKIKYGLKLILSVSMLKRSIAVEIDRNWIRAVNEPGVIPAAFSK